MAKNKFKSFESIFPNDTKYVRLASGMLNHPKYKGLSNGARTVYTVMKLQYDGKNEGNIICPYSALKEYGLSKPTIRKAINELEQNGFIKIMASGGLYRQANVYMLSDEWRNKDK